MGTQGNLILGKIQQYLLAANTDKPGMSEEVINEAGEALKEVLRKTFNEQRPNDFKLYFSNAGRPACQLTMERDKAPKETFPYSFRMKMLLGDATEILARAIIKGSGIPITTSQGRVELAIGPIKLRGKYDDLINGQIWDTKSASSWSFRNKWAKGFEAMAADDAFGYCSQLYGYAEAEKAQAGGWLVINKETGEWLAVEAPDSPAQRKKYIQKLEDNIVKVVDPDRPFTREFTDFPEYFRKKPTGNRVLGATCGFCDYKWSCWPGLKQQGAVMSEAQNPPDVYYTVLVNEGKE